jgi:hypothetical protein
MPLKGHRQEFATSLKISKLKILVEFGFCILNAYRKLANESTGYH